MQALHTLDRCDDMLGVPDRLRLISSARAGLTAQLASRVDAHLATFVERMRGGLLAASTAVGLQVMAELMATEVTELVGPKAVTTRPARRPDPHGDAARQRRRRRHARRVPGADPPPVYDVLMLPLNTGQASRP